MKGKLIEGLVLAAVRRQCWEGWGSVLEDVVYALNRVPSWGASCPIAGPHGFLNPGVRVGVAPIITIPSNPSAEFFHFFVVVKHT